MKQNIYKGNIRLIKIKIKLYSSTIIRKEYCEIYSLKYVAQCSNKLLV